MQHRHAELLANCYKNSLALAVENDLQTIFFPSISTGAFGYQKDEAAKVASRAVKKFLAENETIILANLIFFSAADAEKFIKHQDF